MPIEDSRAFAKIEDGEPMTSLLSKEYADYMRRNRQSVIEVISIEEACEGLNGKKVSYLDYLYKIEDCHKRRLDPEAETLKHPDQKYKELSSIIWISLPEGKPL